MSVLLENWKRERVKRMDRRIFKLRVVPEDEGYGVSLSLRDDKGEKKVAEIRGAPLIMMTDILLTFLRANGRRVMDMRRLKKPVVLDQPTGVKVGLMILALKPMSSIGKMENVLIGIGEMEIEESYYWYSKCSNGSHGTKSAANALKALRIMLAGK